jgi:lipopolysaccharide transport system ATP-binding protein
MSLYVSLDRVSKIFPTGNSAGSDLINAVVGQSPRARPQNGKVAVDQLSLTINEGERIGIVGRNGAGKSTLLHMIAGISDPTSGQIRINGKVTSILTLGVGLRDDLSGRENIYVDGEIQGKTLAEVDKVIDQVIEFSELGKFIDYPVRTYSTGMKARLAFSMISHIDPEILIIDEALSVGDAAFSAKATARILDICAKGKIVILVSHGMQAIRDICNRCLYLKDGQIAMDDVPDAVTKAYIDEVRGEDEAALLTRFAASVGNRSIVNGYALTTPVLLLDESQIPAIRIEAGCTFKIQIRGAFPVNKKDAICNVRIVRMDDLLLLEQDFPVQSFSDAQGALSLEIELAPMPLAPATYRLEVEIRDRPGITGELCAVTSSIFEVYSLSPPAGGKPMLYYPVIGSEVRL